MPKKKAQKIYHFVDHFALRKSNKIAGERTHTHNRKIFAYRLHLSHIGPHPTAPSSRHVTVNGGHGHGFPIHTLPLKKGHAFAYRLFFQLWAPTPPCGPLLQAWRI